MIPDEYRRDASPPATGTMRDVISDDLIDNYLGSLLGNSEPGATLHHLLVAAADPAAHSALGVPELNVTVFAIMPTEEVDAEDCVSQAIVRATGEARQEGAVIHFAGLAMEAYAVEAREDDDEVRENRVRRLLADRKLQEHPDVVEVTRLYAACRDGRRWTGQHYLTGPKAGTILGPTMRTGALAEQEGGVHERLIRTAVGVLTPARGRTRP